MKPEDITDKTFGVGMRGYVRSEVDAFRLELARELAQRDAAIVAREWALAKQHAPPADPEVSEVSAAPPDRSELLHLLGHEAANALAVADEALLERQARLEAGGERVKRTLNEVTARLLAAQEAVAELGDQVLASGSLDRGDA